TSAASMVISNLTLLSSSRSMSVFKTTNFLSSAFCLKTLFPFNTDKRQEFYTNKHGDISIPSMIEQYWGMG
ncbi:MAG: hypothetical protein ACOYIK_01065, partial [Coriobacteriales bacterium]